MMKYCETEHFFVEIKDSGVPFNLLSNVKDYEKLQVRFFSIIGRLDTVTAPEAHQERFVLFGAGGMIKEVLEASDMDMPVKIYETQEDLP